MDELQKIIEEIYPTLPEDLRSAISDPGMKDKFRAIATAHGISEDQLVRLKNETYLVLLGLSDLSDYAGNVKRELEIGLDRATSIALDVHKNIFRSVESTLEAIEEAVRMQESEKEITAPTPNKTDRPAGYTKNLSTELNNTPTSREPEIYSPPQRQWEQKKNVGESLKKIREELGQIPQTPKMTERERTYIPQATKPRVETPANQSQHTAFSPNENLVGRPQPKLTQGKNLSGQSRYGVEPARDLGADDFDWKGSVGGVEIESQYDESGDSDEQGLDKTKILEEIEHPPSYTPKTPFENQVFGNSKQTDFRPVRTPPTPNNLPTGENIPETESRPLEEIEKVRQERYKGDDPYREPLE